MSIHRKYDSTPSQLTLNEPNEASSPCSSESETAATSLLAKIPEYFYQFPHPGYMILLNGRAARYMPEKKVCFETLFHPKFSEGLNKAAQSVIEKHGNQISMIQLSQEPEYRYEEWFEFTEKKQPICLGMHPKEMENFKKAMNYLHKELDLNKSTEEIIGVLKQTHAFLFVDILPSLKEGDSYCVQLKTN